MSVNSFTELLAHVGHDIEVVYYGHIGAPVNVTIECVTCGEVLVNYDRDFGGVSTPEQECDERCAVHKNTCDGYCDHLNHHNACLGTVNPREAT